MCPRSAEIPPRSFIHPRFVVCLYSTKSASELFNDVYGGAGGLCAQVERSSATASMNYQERVSRGPKRVNGGAYSGCSRLVIVNGDHEAVGVGYELVYDLGFRRLPSYREKKIGRLKESSITGTKSYLQRRMRGKTGRHRS